MEKSKMSKKNKFAKGRLASGTLIVVGSNHPYQAKSVESYDPDLDAWSEILDLDIDRAFFRSVILEEKLMLVGGRLGDDYSATLQSYDFTTGVLTTLAPMKQARYLHELVELSRHLFVIGGHDEGFDYINTVERYNPIADEWTDIVPMSIPRGFHGAVVNDGEIYVVGGYNGKHLSSVESYNPIFDTWKTCASMNTIRNEPAVASIGKFVYAVGGFDGVSTLHTAERYDPVTDTWTDIENMLFHRQMSEGVNYNDTMVVAGGYNILSLRSESVESYGNNEWTEMPHLVTPRAHFSLVVVPSSVNIKKSIKSKL